MFLPACIKPMFLTGVLGSSKFVRTPGKLLVTGYVIGPMKGGLSVGRRLEILCNVWRQLGNETVSVG